MDIEQFAAQYGIRDEDIPELLSALAIDAYVRHVQSGSTEDIDIAVGLAKQRNYRTVDDNLSLIGWLNDLGIFLESRYRRTGEMKDLEEAIQTARKAVESTPADHPDRAGRLNNLRTKLESRYERTGEMKGLEEALRYLYDAWDFANAVPFNRVRAAARCLKILATQHKLDAGINLGRAVLELLPTVHTRILDRNDQQFVMSTFAGPAIGPSYRSVKPNLTVARQSVLLTKSMLRSARPLTTPQKSMQRKDVVKLLPSWSLDACIRTIRDIPNHERFLLGQTVAEMQECTGEGTIIVVNMTEFRSDAILVSRNTVKTVPLSQLSASDTRAWLKYLSWLCQTNSWRDLHAEPPDGLASSMPFHAAGLRYEGGSTENTYNRVISSYTPFIKTLAHAQNWAKSEEPWAAYGSLLITTMPTVPIEDVPRRMHRRICPV
ncbi:hypothetical protein V8E54_012708 [Elaphomyces granulatus]